MVLCEVAAMFGLVALFVTLSNYCVPAPRARRARPGAALPTPRRGAVRVLQADRVSRASKGLRRNNVSDSPTVSRGGGAQEVRPRERVAAAALPAAVPAPHRAGARADARRQRARRRRAEVLPVRHRLAHHPEEPLGFAVARARLPRRQALADARLLLAGRPPPVGRAARHVRPARRALRQAPAAGGRLLRPQPRRPHHDATHVRR